MSDLPPRKKELVQKQLSRLSMICEENLHPTFLSLTRSQVSRFCEETWGQNQWDNDDEEYYQLLLSNFVVIIPELLRQKVTTQLLAHIFSLPTICKNSYQNG